MAEEASEATIGYPDGLASGLKTTPTPQDDSMTKLNIEIRKTLSRDKPYAVYIDGKRVADCEDLHTAHRFIRETTSIKTPVIRKITEVKDNDLNALKSFDIIAFNQSAEDRFVQLVTTILETEGPQPVNTIIAETSFDLDISPATAKRYLLKHSARKAEFLVHEKLVRLRKDTIIGKLKTHDPPT